MRSTSHNYLRQRREEDNRLYCSNCAAHVLIYFGLSYAEVLQQYGWQRECTKYYGTVQYSRYENCTICDTRLLCDINASKLMPLRRTIGVRYDSFYRQRANVKCKTELHEHQNEHGNREVTNLVHIFPEMVLAELCAVVTDAIVRAENSDIGTSRLRDKHKQNTLRAHIQCR